MNNRYFFLLILLLAFTTVFCQNEYIREINYKLPEGETETDARTRATNELKRILSDELGSFIVSQTSMQRFEKDNKYNEKFEQSTKNATFNYMKVFIIEEQFSASNLYLKVKIEVDENKLSESLKNEGFSDRSELLSTVFALLKQNNVGLSDILIMSNTEMVLSNMQNLELSDGTRIINITKNINGQIMNGSEVLDGQFQMIYTDGNKANFELENSFLNGAYRYSNRFGKVIVEGSFLKGRKSGTWNHFDLNRDDWYLKQSEQYSEGFLNGEVIEYGGYDLKTLLSKTIYQVGIPVYKILYDNDGTCYQGPLNMFGNKTGEWLSKSGDGMVLGRINYVNDIKEGPAVAYYKNGQVEHEGFYKAGEKTGWYITYYENGQIDTKNEFDDDGKSMNHYVKYSSTGQLLTTIKVQDDQTVKTEQYWDNGNLKEEKLVDRLGHTTGNHKQYFRNGNLQSDELYVNGVKSGYSFYYYEDGTIIKKQEFAANGNPTENYTIFNNKGLVKESSEVLADKNIIFKRYWDNGNLNSQKTVTADGRVSGAYKLFYENGQLQSDENFSNGFKTGLCQYFFDDGKLKMSENYKIVDNISVRDGEAQQFIAGGICIKSYNYKNNNLEGLCKSFYPSGSIKKEENYKADLYNGDVKEYGEDGLLRLHEIYSNGLRTGEWFKVSTNGEKSYTTYENDLLVYEKRCLSDGRIFETNYPTNGELAKHLEYDNEGNLSEETYFEGYINGSKTLSTKNEGQQKAFYKNGQVKQCRLWSSGQLNGCSKDYFESGKLKSIQYYNMGKKENIYASFSDSYGLLTAGNYKDNKKVDEWFLFKRDGSVEKTTYDAYGVKTNFEVLTEAVDVSKIISAIKDRLSVYLSNEELDSLD